MKFRLIDAAWWLTRILRLGNWLLMAAMAAMLVYSLPNHAALVARIAAGHPQLDAADALDALRIITALGIAWTVTNELILGAVGKMIATAQAGDPFVEANVRRLRTIGWALVATQILAFAIAHVAAPIGLARLADGHGWSLSGWMAVLMAFVLAEIFARGAAMRDDLEGTV